jgi:hypothetical protein
VPFNPQEEQSNEWHEAKRKTAHHYFGRSTMNTSSLRTALSTAKLNKKRRSYPDKADPRYIDGIIYPSLTPKFRLDFGSGRPIFTIGSCFARHIEDELELIGVQLPTKEFSVPQSEWPNPPNCLLNEYNPGSISQKIVWTLEGKSSPLETIYEHAGSYYDLLLCGGSGVEYQRAIARRADIAKIYSHLCESDILFVTLGFVECWFDQETHSWLNRMPPSGPDHEVSNRFVLRRLDVDDALELLNKAFEALDSLGKKIIITVSPVPLSFTFTLRDCVIANEYSKSVLRVCAEQLCERFRHVDYYPSYEIVRAVGLSAYEDDNVQVRNVLVRKITRNMLHVYSHDRR